MPQRHPIEAPVLPGISQYFVPGLQASELHLRYQLASGTASKLQHHRLHVMQGSLDQACGLAAGLMAYHLASGVPRNQAVSVLRGQGPTGAGFREEALAMFFQGSTAQTLATVFAELSDTVSTTVVTGSHRKVLGRVLEEIEQGHPTLLSVQDRTLKYCHWVCVVGREVCSDRQKPAKRVKAQAGMQHTTALLGLCPSQPTTPLGAFNWRLNDIAISGATYLPCLSAYNGQWLVTCNEALVFHRNQKETP